MEFIDSEAGLERLCTQLEKVEWLALDTEFERINTYYPEMCLLQLANDGTTAIIDTLAIQNLEPLFSLLYRPSITKVFHAARQDLELFYHIKGEIPQPLFDTQIAATLLGYDSQIGYANLIKEILAVELPKSQTRTNWKRRPLSEKQLVYAADDVIYLAEVYQRFQQRITGSGQMAELQTECQALTQPELYEPDPDTLWKKIRIARRLRGGSLERLKKLAAWRELTARSENQPRKWIMGDHALMQIAEQEPATLADLTRIKGVDNDIVKRHGEKLLQLLTQA